MIATVDRNGDSDDRLAHLDLSRLSFPSDTLNIGTLRKAHSSLFDHGYSSGENAQPQFFFQSELAGHAHDVVANLLFCERAIAAAAYAEASGIPWVGIGTSDLEEELGRQYVKYSIATGAHHAAEMVRGIKQQGAQLAKDKNL